MNEKPPTKGASHVEFPFQHQLMTNALPNIMEKIENIYSTLTCFMRYLHNVFFIFGCFVVDIKPLPWLSNLLPIYESPHATMGILGCITKEMQAL